MLRHKSFEGVEQQRGGERLAISKRQRQQRPLTETLEGERAKIQRLQMEGGETVSRALDQRLV